MAEVIPNRKAGLGVMATGTTIETITGVAAIVLTAIGLFQVNPELLLTIAILVVGAGLFFRGAAIAAEYTRLLHQNGEHNPAAASMTGGASAELVAGAVGIVLGFLVLFSITPPVLAPVALIVLSLGLLINSITNMRISRFRIAMSGLTEPTREASINAAWADASTQMLISIGALVLGSLALLGFTPLELTLVGMLALGTTEMLAGGVLTKRAISMFRSA